MEIDDPINVAIILVIATATIGMFASGIGVGEPRGESQYTGEPIDLEVDRGFIFKTTQAHLRSGDASSQTETFCVPPEHESEQLEKLRQASANGQQVTITYERPLFVGVWDCETDLSKITNVEITTNESN